MRRVCCCLLTAASATAAKVVHPLAPKSGFVHYYPCGGTAASNCCDLRGDPGLTLAGSACSTGVGCGLDVLFLSRGVRRLSSLVLFASVHCLAAPAAV